VASRAGFLLRLFFDPDDGGDTDYMALYPTIPYSSEVLEMNELHILRPVNFFPKSCGSSEITKKMGAKEPVVILCIHFVACYFA
jgi:hypothetical protein